jgi:hypothetical protein
MKLKRLFVLWVWKYKRYMHALKNVSSSKVANVRNWRLVLCERRCVIRSDDDPCDVEGRRRTKIILTKVMWYFPVIAWLKHLFRCKDSAKLMHWHKEERKQDENIRQPADGL